MNEELLKQLIHNTSKQLEVEQKQLLWTRISSCCCIVTCILIVGSVAVLVPALLQISQDAHVILAQFQQLLDDISVITKQLQTIDFTSSMSDISILVNESTEKISALDIDTLNEAISDLSSAVAPLAALFGK